MKWSFLLAVALVSLIGMFRASADIPSTTQIPMPAPLELKSPDGKIVLHFDLKDIGNEKGCPVYDVSYHGQSVLVDSRLGLELRNAELTQKFNLISQQTNSNDTSWKPICGERSLIRDHYNQLVVELKRFGSAPFAHRLTISFRAYNEGVAFAYTVPEDEITESMVDIIGEKTQFAFPLDGTVWCSGGNYAQGDYTHAEIPLSKLPTGAETILPVRLDDHLYVGIGSARIADYARMKLRRSASSDTTLEALLDGWVNRDGVMALSGVLGKAPFITPWRVVMIADSPSKLLEQNYLTLNLNDPCLLTDTSWIKPGKVIREAAFTTEAGKAAVDFAVKHDLSYIEYDAGWYGPEWKTTSDAREVLPSLTENGRLNLQEVIDYGKSKGVGVILYVNQHAMEGPIDEFLADYEKWGVAGVKFGFVNVGSQYWMAKTHEAIRKAAEHHLMVDIHDEFRNMGYERTYPNLMEVEGIGGDETNPTPEHNAALPFTRFLSGPADHTYCWNSKNFKNNKAHQLAISTIFYSPWSFLYWYDSPKTVPDEPALAYWDALPTTWDETRVLEGVIGKRAVVARRKGKEWFVGAIAPVDGKFPIKLDFLPSGKKYTAKIYFDAPRNETLKSAITDSYQGVAHALLQKPSVQITTSTVTSTSVIDADIPNRGGMAIQLAPK